MEKKDDLIVGRKQIMVFLKYENWNSVEKLISREGCPISRVGGRWLAMRSSLMEWFDAKLSQKKCLSLSIFTNIDNLTRDKHSKNRSRKMPELLICYKATLSVSKACQTVGVTRASFYNWRRKYERFDNACRQIEEEILQGESYDCGEDQDREQDYKEKSHKEEGFKEDACCSCRAVYA